jgi:hypothetical protein
MIPSYLHQFQESGNDRYIQAIVVDMSPARLHDSAEVEISQLEQSNQNLNLCDRNKTIITPSPPNQQKIRATSSKGKLPFLSFDLSHQATVTWLIRGSRRTRRDLNGGFITKWNNHWHECKPLHHSADYMRSED